MKTEASCTRASKEQEVWDGSGVGGGSGEAAVIPSPPHTWTLSQVLCPSSCMPLTMVLLHRRLHPEHFIEAATEAQRAEETCSSHRRQRE